jgi:hypothetical protein
MRAFQNKRTNPKKVLASPLNAEPITKRLPKKWVIPLLPFILFLQISVSRVFVFDPTSHGPPLSTQLRRLRLGRWLEAAGTALMDWGRIIRG